MSPQTIRRLAVVAVATLGVVMLYLWPTSAKSPSGAPREVPVSTSVATAPSSPEGPTSAAPSGSPSATGSPTPYDPEQRVDTHSPPTTAPPPGESTPAPPRDSPSGPSTSPTPSRGSTPTSPPSTTEPPTTTPTPTPSEPTVDPTPPETSDPPPQACQGPHPTPSETPGPSDDPSGTPTPSGPPAPTGLHEVEDDNDATITLAWTAPPDEDVSHYLLYVDDQMVCSVSGTTAVWQWPDDDTPDHTVQVAAVDSDGTVGALSERLTVTHGAADGNSPNNDEPGLAPPASPSTTPQEEPR